MDWHLIWTAVLSIMTLLLSIVAALSGNLWRQMREDVKKLQDQAAISVTRSELEDKFRQLQEDRKEMHRENTDSLRRIEDKLDRWAKIDAELTDCRRELQALRDWKHEKMDALPNEMTNLERRLAVVENRRRV